MITESIPLIIYTIREPILSYFSTKAKFLQLEPGFSSSILVIDPSMDKIRNYMALRCVVSVRSVRGDVSWLSDTERVAPRPDHVVKLLRRMNNVGAFQLFREFSLISVEFCGTTNA